MRTCTTLLVLNLCIIWGNSLLPGEISGAFSDWVKEILLGILAVFLPAGDIIPGSGVLLRKIGHFTEFTMLGMCLTWLFGMLRKGRFWPLLCGIGAACVDETIQRFVPDRGPSIIDVGIDTCGVITGMALLLTGYYLRRKRNKTNQLEDTK